ncbi:unnamed protein product [Caenorhabditis nigoni]
MDSSFEWIDEPEEQKGPEFQIIQDKDFLSNIPNLDIQDAINGEWKILNTTNMDAFLDSQPDINWKESTRIRSSNICFYLKGKILKICNFYNDRKNLDLHFLPFPNRDGVKFLIEDNKLVSTQYGPDGRIFSKMERQIQDNGNLKIVWERNGAICERVYEKLPNWSSTADPFENFY